jgi:hypothetical protein
MRTFAPLPVLTALRERVQHLEREAARHRSVLPFGIETIDRHLPEGGLALGALHDVAGGGNLAIDGAAAALFTAGIAAARGAKSCGASRVRTFSRPPSPRPGSRLTASFTWKLVTSRRYLPVSRRDCGMAGSARRSPRLQGFR